MQVVLHFLAKYPLVLDPYINGRHDFGADYVDDAMLPVDRFHLKWEGTPPSLIHRYTTASTLKVDFLHSQAESLSESVRV